MQSLVFPCRTSSVLAPILRSTVEPTYAHGTEYQLRAHATWPLACTLLPYARSATSYGIGGNATGSGPSSDSNTESREPSRFRKGRALYSASHSRIAVRSSSSEPNPRSRIAAASAMAACHTVFSAEGLSFGLFTRPGNTAAEQCPAMPRYASFNTIPPSRGCLITPVLRSSHTRRGVEPPNHSHTATRARSHVFRVMPKRAPRTRTGRTAARRQTGTRSTSVFWQVGVRSGGW